MPLVQRPGSFSLGIPYTFTINGEDSSDPQLIADAFAQFFAGYYITSGPRLIGCSQFVNSSSVLDIPSFSEGEVLASLKRLKGKLTAVPDMIPSFLLKDCSLVFARPLTALFNLCLSTETFPDGWKLSKLTPIHKKGSKCEVQNYRPITIINNFSKVFEMVLHERISTFFRDQLVDCQHGFVSGRSTVTNLCCITQYLSESIDDKHQCDVIYTDFSKAFDQLDHGI